MSDGRVYFVGGVIWCALLAVTLYGLRFGRVLGSYEMWDKSKHPGTYWTIIGTNIFFLVILLVVGVIAAFES